METATLLSRVAWQTVNEKVRHEQRNREVYVPPISLYRWWARRPHALIGALIDVACEDVEAPVVSDPFSGGGTVAMEAARRGLPLYAQDLHPWALAGLTSVLGRVDADALELAMNTVLETVSLRCGELYSSSCPDHGDASELSHVFWVRTRECPSCRSLTHLYPYSLVSLSSRRKNETKGYFGCSGCGCVSQHPAAGRGRRRCPGCDRRIEDPDTPLLAGRSARCVQPTCEETFAAFDGVAPGWELVLVQRVCLTSSGAVSHFDTPTTNERESPALPPLPKALLEEIPDGVETSLLRRAGFRRWADVYPPRQLRVLLECSAAIDDLDTSDVIRARLRLALCGAAEMAGFLSRWDRYYPKAFEAMANHRFPALGFASETNLLARRGRGTLRRRFAQSVSAARWANENLVLGGAVRVATSGARRRQVGQGALLVCGSSERQLPSDASVDLVLTDPPYFDDVQYAELASLLLAWARAVGLVPTSVSLDVGSEAVGNHTRGSSIAEYRTLLTRIFCEARRTLKPAGRLILTFHNTDIRAWWALARALQDAALYVCALAVADAENSADHGKRDSNAFTSDLVIECHAAPRRGGTSLTANAPATPESRELLAAGRTLAQVGSVELAEFIEHYRNERGTVEHPRIRIPKQEAF